MFEEIDEATIAWFGGWLSADGSIVDAGGGRPRIRFVVTDRDPLDRFAALFGNRVIGPLMPTGLGKRPRFEWRMSGEPAAELLKRVRPWLSTRYRGRAELLDAYRRGPLLRKLTPESIRVIRATPLGYGTGRRLAERYGVSEARIGQLRTR